MRDFTRILNRFLGRIEEDPETNCWLWTGTISGSGYGVFQVMVEGVFVYHYAHRFAYEAFIGLIPEGLQIDHLCRVRHCANPGHLEAVSNRTNVLRGEGLTALRAAATHCIHGHPFDAENTYYRPDSPRERQCKACRREANRRWRAARRVAVR